MPRNHNEELSKAAMSATRLLCAAIAALSALTSTAATMTTPGTFRVNEMGAATYTIPIQVPPGVGGVEPKLTLAYNSQAGNGLVGVGWGLSGLSSITRCPRTVAQDGVRGTVNYDLNDRYCLDGQRLMLVSGSYGADGSEYRLELDAFSKVVAHGIAGNGPAWFDVWTKDGRYLQYGNTTDSRVLAQGKASAAAWAQNRLENRKGNYFTVSYTLDGANGQFYPNKIDYGGNSRANTAPTASVIFGYEARPDVIPAYQAGSLFQLTVRLNKITAQQAGQPVREYNLAYAAPSGVKRSKLASVTECAAGTCLSPVQLTWAASDMTDFSIMGSNGGSTSGLAAGYYANNGKSYLVPQAAPGTTPYVPNHISWVVYGFSPTGAMSTAASGSIYFGPCRDDMCPQPTPDPFAVDANGAGSQQVVNSASIAKAEAANYSSGSIRALAWLPRDVFGDGRNEIVAHYEILPASDRGSSSYALQTIFVSNGKWVGSTGRGVPKGATLAGTGDFNGDGYLDVVMKPSSGSDMIYWGNSSGTWTATTTLSYLGGSLIGDFNGDGKSDLVTFINGSRLWLSRGDGTFDIRAIALPSGYPGIDSTAARVGDFNGDGRSDILHVGFRVTYVWLSNGDGTFTIAMTSNDGNVAAGQLVVGDFLGDGRTGVFNGATKRVWFSNPTNTADTVTQIRSGSGLTLSLAYSSLAYRGCNSTGAAYPSMPACPPLYVVDSAASNDGSGIHTLRYNYGGLLKRMDGRGWLGFAWIEETDADRGLVTRTDYNQTWPLTGTVAKTMRRGTSVGNGGILAQTAHSYSSVALGNGRSFVASTQSVTSRWDLNGAALPTLTTTRSYDCQSATSCYGNLLSETTSGSDGYSKTVTTNYSNDPSSWLIGLPTRQTVAATTP